MTRKKRWGLVGWSSDAPPRKVSFYFFLSLFVGMTPRWRDNRLYSCVPSRRPWCVPEQLRGMHPRSLLHASSSPSPIFSLCTPKCLYADVIMTSQTRPYSPIAHRRPPHTRPQLTPCVPGCSRSS
jgi:hypothetical protein